ncbi:transmembrane channel-like protein 5 [Gracilinanus agilis]|uniref:transmembrane channel-like protein 5 n=1 Tax=Gracilinanus agilis TaxID=191870 RepID=UPI001CFD6D43|nr:transmembrane channel-like protein 5 [Gracilinanus agilis]
MTSFYRNRGYEEDPDYPDFPNSRENLGSRNTPDYSYSRKNADNQKPQNNAKYSNTHNYPDYPNDMNSPDYSGGQDYPYNLRSRNHEEYPDSYPNTNFSRSQNTPDYLYSRDSSHHSRSRHNPDSLDFPMTPDYSGAKDFGNFRESTNYQRVGSHASSSNSKNYPDRLNSLGTSDYRSAKDYVGSRNNPDFLRTRNNQSYPDSLGISDYPDAKNDLDSPDNWGSAYYQGSKNSHDYSFPENPEMGRGFSPRLRNRVLQRRPSFHHPHDRTSGSPGRRSQDYPESFQMTTRQPASQYIQHPGSDPDGGYRNSAYEDESRLDGAYGNQYLGREDEYMGDTVNYVGGKRNWFDEDLTLLYAAEKTKQEERLVVSLINLTSGDANKIIREQPLTMQEKRKIKENVNLEKQRSIRFSVQLNCCTKCLSTIFLHFRRFRGTMSEFFQSMQVWQRTLKIIGGKFGTSVLSYFSFLTWLLKFNILSFIVNFSFITIPQLMESKPNNLSFSSLELLTGAGYFQQTVLYYGFYTNSTIMHKGISSSYNMQLAYIFTIGLYLVICFFCLLYSMACSFRNNFINPHIYSRGTAKVVFSWDFTITNEKAVKLKQRNLTTEIKETLSEIRHENVIAPLKQRMNHLGIHLGAWIVSTGVAIASCVAVYYLSFYNLKFLTDHKNQAATLLLPFMVCCINLFVPLFYSSFGLVEKFEIPRHQVFVIITRNIFLKISIIGILCYYWLNAVAISKKECWETLVGQDIYRLLMMNFVFTLFDSFCGEFLRRIIGTKLIKSLGVPEFDIARNVLELIYTQTLLWIGIFFSPLLPFIHMITLFIMFHIKKISLMMNCQPPSKAWRASQMMTLFIFLLFFPSFTGVLCVLAITVWRLKPSDNCGPFQGLPSIIHAIYGWIEILSNKPGYLWVVWIYRNLIGSVHFFFILTVIVLIITYLYWQIIEGRKIMIKLLHEQIINEGKDKVFLVEKLLKVQEAQKKPSPFSLSLERREVERESGTSLDRVAADIPERSRYFQKQNLELMEENYLNNDTREEVTSEETSQALSLAMLARQQAEMET